MMRLSTMWKVDSTVGADRSSPVAQQILERWGYDRGSVQFFRSSANFIYRFRDQEEPRFLRFADATERSRDVIDAEMEVLHAVAAAGIHATVPVRSRYGNAVETVDTDWGTFHGVVFPAFEGAQLELDGLAASGFRHWGAALGRLHTAMGTLAVMPARPTWHDHLALTRNYLPEDSPRLRAELDRIAASLAALPVTQDTYGLIHGDFELDNLVWREDAVGILDFDDCSHLWYAADIAFALRDLFESGAEMSDWRFQAFVQGYREHHPLNEESLSSVPLFLKLSRLLTYARIARAVDLAAGPEQPDWLLGLNKKLLQRMAAYQASVESA